MENTAIIPRDYTSAFDPLSILVVDPHDDTRQLYRECFEFAGCVVTEASDGRDGLAKALALRQPSLIVTELCLPFIDGLALCELLRLDAATCNVPLVVVTSEHRAAQLAQAKQAGADAVLMKPTLPDNVLRVAVDLLKRSTQVPEHPAATRTNIAALIERSANMLSAGADEQRRPSRSKSHARFDTTTPPIPPPELMCPSCDRSLRYAHSHVGGVSDRNPEQWDYYACPRCGTFQYRQRTRKLRRVL